MCLLRGSFFFFFKQKTAYEMRISDWSSDVCSSELGRKIARGGGIVDPRMRFRDDRRGRGVERAFAVIGLGNAEAQFDHALPPAFVRNAVIEMVHLVVAHLAEEEIGLGGGHRQNGRAPV